MDNDIKRIADQLPNINLIEILEDIERYLPIRDGNLPRFVPTGDTDIGDTDAGDTDEFILCYDVLQRTGIYIIFLENGLRVTKPCKATMGDGLGAKTKFFEWCDPKNGYDPKVIADYILHG